MKAQAHPLAILISACCLAPSIAFLIPGSSIRQSRSRLFKADNGDDDTRKEHLSLDRRQLLLSGLTLPFLPWKADARGLMQFPVDDPKDMLNTYHFLRVGSTLLEEEDIWCTNPLFLTNREVALSPTGQEQIQAACAQMEKLNTTPGVVKYSLAASCVDTSNIVGDTLNLGRDRIVPEFSFLDPRGIGRWEMLSLKTTQPAVWALDALEAGPNGDGGRPPANEDSTPNETLQDQAVRLRQVMSIMETQFSGETILIIFPDSTGPALLSAMIAGIPLNRVHELEFGPGELRMDITKANILNVLKERGESSVLAYEGALAAGREELAKLRSTKDIVNLKDQKIEAERIAIDKKYNEKEDKRIALEKAERQEREDRAREVREQQQEKREERAREVREQQREEKMERQQIAAVGRQSTPPEADTTSPLVGIGAAALVGTAGLFASAGTSAQQERSELKQDPVGSKDSSSEEEVNAAQPPPIKEVETAVEPVDLLEELSLEETVVTPPSPEPIDPVEAAEKAMQEYLDKDDGGEDWLTVMSELLDEEIGDLEEVGEKAMNKTSSLEA